MLVSSHADTDAIAMAHHGSVSKDRRKQIEEQLKRGQLRCVVATSSLELGIDMGSVDLVIQIAPPLSVSSGLQRVGRADHKVGGVSHALFYPITREQIIGTAASIECMRSGDIETLTIPCTPLDVLAQQTVAAAAMDDLKPDDWYVTVRKAAPFEDLDRNHVRCCDGHDDRRLQRRGFLRLPATTAIQRRGGSHLRAPWRSTTGRDQRRHHTRPRNLHRGASRRRLRTGPTQSGGAGRGNGVRIPGRRRHHPRHIDLADPGNHPGPCGGGSCSRAYRPTAVLAWRRRRAGRGIRTVPRPIHTRYGARTTRGSLGRHRRRQDQPIRHDNNRTSAS